MSKSKPPRPENGKAPNKPLSANANEVVLKLRRALDVALTGDTAGAVLIELDQMGCWTADRAGQLRHDDDTMMLISSRMFGACLNDK